MSTVESILLSVVVLHCLFGIFNFGATMAYMTRNHVSHQDSLLRIIRVYVTAFAAFTIGIFMIPSGFAAVSWPTYGWKLWHGEFGKKNRWKELKKQKRSQWLWEQEKKARQSSKADGSCESIWE